MGHRWQFEDALLMAKPAATNASASPVLASASLVHSNAQHLVLAGAWTALHLGEMEHSVKTLEVSADALPMVDAHQLSALDSAGASVLHTLLTRLQASHGAHAVTAAGLSDAHQALLAAVATHVSARSAKAATTAPAAPTVPTVLPVDNAVQALGRRTHAAAAQGLAVLALLGEVAITFGTTLRHPKRWRWRQVLFNIRTAGVDALPIVGLLAFLLGIVVAYQSADQLRQFGANIFIVDVVGLSMLREFAPMMTAIIIAGRSGSAYAAQIGTMAVTEEIDALRTLGIVPLEVLVLPKVLALVIALPLLTLFADVAGVLGGMLMAYLQLGVSFEEFGDRFAKAVSVTAYWVGIGKAPMFAVIIVVIGCFQGLQTRGGADSVGRQTTRAVVQSTFLVIVADALFSIAFSALDL
jgi:phospholipid/cholesterol/gamma-HCH transport system permease protein